MGFLGPAVSAGLAANQDSPPIDPGEATLRLIRLFVLVVGVAAIGTMLARRIHLPYTVALVAFGMLAAAVSPLAVSITPQLVLVVLLPALVFDAAYRIDFGKLRSLLLGVGLLAGPGVLVSAALVAIFLNLGTGLPMAQAFVVGAMLAATDPVAVIATFRGLGSPRRLSTLIEAESLFNDGTGIVAFSIPVSFVSAPVAAWQMGLSFAGVVLVSTLVGLATGWLASRLLVNVGDHLIEICLSVVLAYGTYLLADAASLSGVIATAVAGIVLGNYGRRLGLSERTEQALDTIWEFVAFLATAFVFLLIGFVITPGQLFDAAGPIAWAVAAVLISRAIIVYGFLGALRLVRRRTQAPPRVLAEAAERESTDRDSTERESTERESTERESTERDFPLSWFHVIYWAGLRGAVSTALALSLPADFPNRSLLAEITFGVVLFTLLVQATTAELVVRRWGRKPTRPRKRAKPPKVAGQSKQPKVDKPEKSKVRKPEKSKA